MPRATTGRSSPTRASRSTRDPVPATDPRRPAPAPACGGVPEPPPVRSVDAHGDIGRAVPAVPVLEANDVVEVGGRALQEERVLERSQPVHHAGSDVEAAPGRDLLGGRLCSGLADLDRRATLVEVDRLVLVPVELKAQRLAGADEENLSPVLLSSL